MRSNVPDFMIKGNQTLRFVVDHQGSVRLVVDTQTGAILQAIDYDVFGKKIRDTNPGFQPFGFAGGLHDNVGIQPACRSLGVAPATFYRRRSPKKNSVRESRLPSPRSLSEEEKTTVLRVLTSERFVDRAPAEVVATLLDDGLYLCSERTMYRILKAKKMVRERRAQRRHPNYAKPELVVSGPNPIWSLEREAYPWGTSPN